MPCPVSHRPSTSCNEGAQGRPKATSQSVGMRGAHLLPGSRTLELIELFQATYDGAVRQMRSNGSFQPNTAMTLEAICRHPDFDFHRPVGAFNASALALIIRLANEGMGIQDSTRLPDCLTSNELTVGSALMTRVLKDVRRLVQSGIVNCNSEIAIDREHRVVSDDRRISAALTKPVQRILSFKDKLVLSAHDRMRFSETAPYLVVRLLTAAAERHIDFSVATPQEPDSCKPGSFITCLPLMLCYNPVVADFLIDHGAPGLLGGSRNASSALEKAVFRIARAGLFDPEFDEISHPYIDQRHRALCQEIEDFFERATRSDLSIHLKPDGSDVVVFLLEHAHHLQGESVLHCLQLAEAAGYDFKGKLFGFSLADPSTASDDIFYVSNLLGALTYGASYGGLIDVEVFGFLLNKGVAANFALVDVNDGDLKARAAMSPIFEVWDHIDSCRYELNDSPGDEHMIKILHNREALFEMVKRKTTGLGGSS